MQMYNETRRKTSSVRLFLGQRIFLVGKLSFKRIA